MMQAKGSLFSCGGTRKEERMFTGREICTLQDRGSVHAVD